MQERSLTDDLDAALSEPLFKDMLEKMEATRAEISKRRRISNFLYFLAALAVVATLVMESVFFLIPALAFVCFGFFNISERIRVAQREYKAAFKLKLLQGLMKKMELSMEMRPEQGISQVEFESTGLFNHSPDRYYTEDLILGKSEKTSFYFAEVNAEYKTESTNSKGEKTVTWHTILQGIVFAADFNKEFKNKTIVRPRRAEIPLLGGLLKKIFSSGQQEIVLEDPVFSKKFTVYGADQIESRYILTPAMMQRILALSIKTRDEISVSFYQSKVYIAFSTESKLFEAPIYKSLINSPTLRRDILIIHSMLSVVSDLDLNTRIWTKQ